MLSLIFHITGKETIHIFCINNTFFCSFSMFLKYFKVWDSYFKVWDSYWPKFWDTLYICCLNIFFLICTGTFKVWSLLNLFLNIDATTFLEEPLNCTCIQVSIKTKMNLNKRRCILWGCIKGCIIMCRDLRKVLFMD